MKLSSFGERFTGTTGIGLLMDDLNEALSTRSDMLMLGGGNPGYLKAVQELVHYTMQSFLCRGDAFERAMGTYDGPAGNDVFREAMAELLATEFGWPVTRANIGLTNGSQQAFFMLFNTLAGPCPDGIDRKILLPLAPEYIGYADVGISSDLFTAAIPGIEQLEEHVFKYRVDFDALNVADNVNAICVSRPTNPTGNVVTDDEVRSLAALARARDIPLIIDNAYGTPFPNILYTDVTPYFDDNTIVCMSLSKFGVPAVRTGIVIAAEHVIKLLAALNSVVCLAPVGIGAALMTELVRSRRIITAGRQIIQPYYKSKRDKAMALLHEHLDGVDWQVHVPEGAFFFWLRFPDMPVDNHQLYEKLKERGVVVVPGRYFFPGLEEDWEHRHDTIRITYAQHDGIVEKGIATIGEVVKEMQA
jgi:valine--pyruvate aminotransferase